MKSYGYNVNLGVREPTWLVVIETVYNEYEFSVTPPRPCVSARKRPHVDKGGLIKVSHFQLILLATIIQRLCTSLCVVCVNDRREGVKIHD